MYKITKNMRIILSININIYINKGMYFYLFFLIEMTQPLFYFILFFKFMNENCNRRSYICKKSSHG